MSEPLGPNGGVSLLSDIDRWTKNNRTRLSALLGLVFLALARPTPETLLWGLVPVLAGESLRIWSSGYIHKNQALTVTGPYSLSRNPLYLGSFILGLGFLIGMGVVWMLIFFLLFFAVVYRFTIRWEESKLKDKFPGEWESYSGRVPRFLPLGRMPVYTAGEFSWAQVLKHRELAHASIVLVVYLILWGKALFLGG